MVQNKGEATLLVSILLLASFFRLWKIDQYLPFLGDEGRDVRIVRHFVTQFDLMFIGPRTSIGDMYLGPLYYYFISPWLFLFNFSPVGPAVSVAILGVATVWFVWKVTGEWFGKAGAVVAAFLYAISPTVVTLSKHSWNPNIMPFFALLCVYGVWRVVSKKQDAWLVVSGIAYAFVLQSHYLGLLLFPLIGLLWLTAFRNSFHKKNRKHFMFFSLAAVICFVLLMSPLVLFDYKHGWHNFSSMRLFFFHRQETVSAKPWHALPLVWPLWNQIFTSLVASSNKLLGLVGSVGVIAGSAYYLWKRKESSQKLLQNPASFFFNYSIVLVWLGIGLVGLGSLKQNIYDHYFGFLFPVPFLLLGAISQDLWEKKQKWVMLTGVAAFSLFNLMNNPLRSFPQNQLKRTEEIDQKILQEAGSKPFNLGLIAERNYNEGYMYFFDLWNSPVREADPQHVSETVTDQLFVICEKSDCNPTTDSSTQIAHFGMSEVISKWEVKGIQVFKLVHKNQ